MAVVPGPEMTTAPPCDDEGGAEAEKTTAPCAGPPIDFPTFPTVGIPVTCVAPPPGVAKIMAPGGAGTVIEPCGVTAGRETEGG